MKKKQDRIFLSLIEIAGFYINLQKGFLQNGVSVDTGFTRPHKFQYDQIYKKKTVLHRIIMWLGDIIHGPYHFIIRVIVYGVQQLIFMPLYLIHTIFRYDTFIFGFGLSFLLFNLDVPILKLLRKKVIVYYNGSDSRPPYLNGNFSNVSPKKRYKLSKSWKKKIVFLDRYADVVIDHACNAHFHEKQIVQAHKLGVPYDTKSLVHDNMNIIPIIVHSPSKPETKGTYLIREVLKSLRQEGYKYEYVELINKTNQEVLDTLSRADFVIDQLYSDTPMAGFATEAASFGKPAIVGGYELDRLKNLMKTEERAPAYQIKPTSDELKKAIIHLIENSEYRQNLGLDAYNFIKRQWSTQAVANRFLRIINNNIPDDWFYNPNKTDFVYGVGCTNTVRQNMIKTMIEYKGVEALCLADKPLVEKRVIDSLSSDH